RLPGYANLHLHLDRPVKIGAARLIPQLDVFNVFNNNIVQAVRVTENAANANQVHAITAPRVLRFGLKASWWATRWRSVRAVTVAVGCDRRLGTAAAAPVRGALCTAERCWRCRPADLL